MTPATTSSGITQTLNPSGIQAVTVRSPTTSVRTPTPVVGRLDFANWATTDFKDWGDEDLISLFGEDKTYGSQVSGDEYVNDPWMTLSEQERYDAFGRADPRYKEAMRNATNTADPIDDIIAKNPGILGQLNFRSIEGSSPDSAWFQDPEKYYASQLGAIPEYAGLLSQSQSAMGQQWRQEMSPGEQSKRNDPDDDGLLGSLLPMALMLVPGFQTLAPALQGAIMGGVGSAISGGNPLKGAVLGGLGGYAGGAISGSSFAQANPVLGKALAGGAQGLIASGGNPKAALSGGVTGGLGQFLGGSSGGQYSGALPQNLSWAASPLASVGSQLAISGKVDPTRVLQAYLNSQAKSNNSGVRAPAQPLRKG